MANVTTDLITKVRDGGNAVVTTVSSSRSPGGVSLSCDNLGYWPNETVHFMTYRKTANGAIDKSTQQDFKGIVSGNTIGSVTLKYSATGVDFGNAIGDFVQMAPTSAYGQDLYDALTAEHKQDGKHGAITTDSVTSVGAITGTTLTGASIVSTGDIQLRSTSLETINSELVNDHVASGCVITRTSGLGWSLSAGVVYIAGRRYTVAATTGNVTANKDTYFDVTSTGSTGGVAVLVNTSGNVVTNNAASPALAASSIRIGIVVSGASIVNDLSINQGQYSGTDAVRLPNYGTTINIPVLTDIKGVPIYPKRDARYVGGITRSAAASSGAPGGTSVSNNAGNAIPLIAKPQQNYILHITESVISGWAGTGAIIFEIYYGATAGAYTTQLNEQTVTQPNASPGINISIPFNMGSISGLCFIGIKLRTGGITGTATFNTDTTRNGVYLIEEVR